jgi:hypothetical protein
MNKKYKLIAVIVSLALISTLFASCSVDFMKNGGTSTTNDKNASGSGSEEITVSEEGTVITLKDTSVSVSGSGAKADGANVIISEGGTYTLSGKLSDGRIVVDSDGDVTVVLDNADITCTYSSAIYVYNAKSCTIYLKDGTKNTISDGSSYDYSDSYSSEADEEPNACLYSKDDLIIAGGGGLTVNGNLNNGITGKDTLVLENVALSVNAKNTGIKGKDSLEIKSGAYTVECDGDALHGDGNVTIENGSFSLKSGDDGIHADNTVTINNGTFTIDAHEAIEGTIVIINDGTISISASDDGINAAQKIEGVTPSVEINGGTVNIEMGQGDTDAIDSNGNLTINGGTINITAQSPFDWDGTASLNGGTVVVNGSTVTEFTNQFGGMGGMGGMQPPSGDGQFPQGGMQPPSGGGQPPQGVPDNNG